MPLRRVRGKAMSTSIGLELRRLAYVREAAIARGDVRALRLIAAAQDELTETLDNQFLNDLEADNDPQFRSLTDASTWLVVPPKGGVRHCYYAGDGGIGQTRAGGNPVPADRGHGADYRAHPGTFGEPDVQAPLHLGTYVLQSPADGTRSRAGFVGCLAVCAVFWAAIAGAIVLVVAAMRGE
jgi:hypothetical protein